MKTPQQSYPALAKAIGIKTLYLKREDQHTYGSHKGRSIPLMIKIYMKRDKISDFVISSSGNAALAAIRMAIKHNMNNPNKQIRLRVFIGKKIAESKLRILEKEIENPKSGIKIEQVDRPKQKAFQLDKSGNAKSLRQSTDDLALEGYVNLADELYKIPQLSAIFIPTSSGTTAQSIANVFAEKKNIPQVHIVQTESCHPIAKALGATSIETNISIANAIVDNVAHRLDTVVNAIQKTNGAGWIPTDDEIIVTQKLVKEITNIDISPNSALSVAGLKKAITYGIKFEGSVVCIITGA